MSNNRLHKYSLRFGATKTCIREFCSIGRVKFTLVHNIIVQKLHLWRKTKWGFGPLFKA